MSCGIKKGFTLIELLVVISIIGLLAAIVLAALSSARQSANDARRIEDVHSLQLAITLYYDTHGFYPVGEDDTGASGWGSDYSDQGTSFIPILKTENFITSVVKDPTTFYIYTWRNGGIANNNFINLNCGTPPQAKAYILVIPERGLLPGMKVSGGSPNANVVCFY